MNPSTKSYQTLTKGQWASFFLGSFSGAQKKPSEGRHGVKNSAGESKADKGGLKANAQPFSSAPTTQTQRFFPGNAQVVDLAPTLRPGPPPGGIPGLTLKNGHRA